MCHNILFKMKAFFIFIRFIILLNSFYFISCHEYGNTVKWPTVMYCILARNKQHTLPYFLTLLNNLDYPKDRMAISIHSDYNIDHTTEILKAWFVKFESQYHSVHLNINEEFSHMKDERGASHWPKSRYQHVVSLRNSCLVRAKNIWADYVFMVDADVFLTDKSTLKYLVEKNYNIVAPMLRSDTLYSNFWCGMTANYYYSRTEDYLPTLDRQRIGCFNVPMIHSAVLINMRNLKIENISYDPDQLNNYNGPYDDIIAFALLANRSDEELYICNDKTYGYITTPLEQDDELSKDSITNIMLQSIADDTPLIYDSIFEKYIHFPTPSKLGFDEIYMINLLRRPARRIKMEKSFKELGIDAKVYDAVDGKELNSKTLKEMGISFLPGYLDPHEKRPMTAGEVGCFLSHYFIWKEIIEKDYQNVLILEDDVRFEPFFNINLQRIMNEIQSNNIEWDLIYLGRKPMDKLFEPTKIQGLIYAGYSYWTLAYIINKDGARKLLNAKPLEKLVPVDEFIPIMSDKHINPTWTSYFRDRNLIALSVNPLFVFPTHYTGQPGHFSDTEASQCLHEL